MKLTEDRITKLECPAGKKDVLVFDEVQRGLAVRVYQLRRKDLSGAVHFRRLKTTHPARRADVGAGAIGGGEDHGRCGARPRSGRGPQGGGAGGPAQSGA